ncbi:MAG: nitrate/nitrite transporter [bacterium]
MAAMYFTIILSLQKVWEVNYERLFELWFPASIIIGLFSIPAGRLADKWSSPGMLIIMFLGMGFSSFLASLVKEQYILMLFLGSLGLFAAIYHPVGIPWMIKTSESKPGIRLAINGLFGGLGASGAAIITGWIISNFGWRSSFAIPGLCSVLIGILMFLCLKYKKLKESNNSSTQASNYKESNSNIYAVMLMMLPMFVMGLIYNSVQGIMPKLFEERMPDILNGKIELVGTIVGFVYAVGAISQILGGYLADKCNHKLLYLSIWLAQAPLLLLIANYGGFPVAFFTCILTMSGTSALPTENIMLSKYASNDHQGLTFGAKFLVTFCAAPLGVYLITHFRETTGEFTYVLFTLSVTALISCISIIFLPNTGNKK